MDAASILEAKGNGVVVATAEKPLLHIASLLAQYHIGCIVIVEDDKICGIISERDLIRAIGELGRKALTKPISDFMTTAVVTAGRANTCDWLLSKMTAKQFRHIPIVEMGRLIGIVSMGDIVKVQVASAESESAAMQAHISSS